MFQYELVYKDWNDVEKKRTLYFNMSEPEMILWQSSESGGLSNLLQRMIDMKDSAGMVKFFDEILSRSYGERSDDGEDFVKSPEVLNRFKSSRAYEEFFMRLFNDTDLVIKWIKGIIPARYREEIEKDENLKKQLSSVK